MELVYIYIDKFKNLEGQEVNFSPLVTFTFDKENKTLSFEKRSDQPKNFFSENILNITGLIGGNGSGKTSILEYILRQKLYLEFSGYVFIYHDLAKKNYVCFHTNLVSNEVDGVVNQIVTRTVSDPRYSQYNPKQLIIYFSNFYHGIQMINKRILSQQIDIYDISTDSLTDLASNTQSGISLFYIIEMIYFLHFFSQHDNFLNQISFPSPKFVSFYINLLEEDYFKDNVGKIKITTKIEQVIKELADLVDQNNAKNGEFKFAFILAILVMLKEIEEIPDNLMTFDKLISLTNLELSKTVTTWLEYLYSKGKAINEDLLFIFFNFLDKIKEKASISIQGSAFPIKDIQVFLQIMSSIPFYLYYPFKFIWSKDENGIPIRFSGGENTMISLFSRIYDCNLQNKDRSILILLDEPDISLHPNYQKRFLSYFIAFLEEVYPEKKNQFQIIITSHSPFIASDLPKDNVQYLDEDKENKQETFAANIHDLLANSYYMKDGFVGAFAKQQINKVIEQLESKDNLESEKASIEYLISRVGEPLVKKHLQSMFDVKFNTPYDERISNLKLEIERLEKEKNQFSNSEQENRNEDG